MNVLETGIRVTRMHEAYMFGDDRLGSKIHITAPPPWKRKYHADTGKDLLEEIEKSVQKVPSVISTTISNRAVHVMASRLHDMHPGYLRDRNDTVRRILNALMKSSASWERPSHTHQDAVGPPTLQHLIIGLLKQPAYQLESCMHHSAEHGVSATRDMLDLTQLWSGL